ncbi:zinc ribbon domain-containing protein [Aliinostoc sp. HNIBRCY26]|uniref:zinc ribbon domain-containing protein n=1 Tax=Aliinostoc sp. HNIBRCY26 TaxID=3418997 RepID=UPI003D024C44
MATISCPKCQQIVDSQAITCPYCRTTLKAYGHPGVTLHRAKKNEYLCDSCTYHEDDTCNFPQRPYAQDCTLYENIAERQAFLEQQNKPISLQTTISNWIQRYQAILILVVLLFICLLIAMR